MKSSKPQMHNASKRRDADYQKILQDHYRWPLRTIFRARPGHLLIEADYSGAELFVTAVQAQDELMIDHCLRKNLPKSDPRYYNMHKEMAKLAFRVDEPEDYLVDHAKTVLFGLLYGRGAKAIALATGLSQDEAQHLIDTILGRYQGLDPFFDACKKRIYDPGHIRNCYGRLRRFPDTTFDELQARDMERVAMNYPIQSAVASAVDRAIRWLIYWRDTLQRRRELFNLSLQIHDALMAEVPLEYAVQVIDEAFPYAMVEQVPLWSCDLDGRRKKGPYYFGIEVKCFEQWGTPITHSRCRELGLPERLGVEDKEEKKQKLPKQVTAA